MTQTEFENEARWRAGAIIEWCCDRGEHLSDENYPQEVLMRFAKYYLRRKLNDYLDEQL